MHNASAFAFLLHHKEGAASGSKLDRSADGYAVKCGKNVVLAERQRLSVQVCDGASHISVTVQGVGDGFLGKCHLGCFLSGVVDDEIHNALLAIAS